MHGDAIRVVEQDTGRTIDIDQLSVEPFGLDALLDTRSEGNQPIPLVIRGKQLFYNGQAVDGSPVLRATTEFNYSPKPFVLVPGGWVPLALSPVHHFLIDRNILSLMQQLHEGRSSDRLERIAWWCQQLNRPSVALNPLPIAWEGDTRQIPSFTQIRQTFQSACTNLATFFPKARVVQFDRGAYDAVYAEIDATRSRQQQESELLQVVCQKYLANPVKRGQRRSVFEEILALAKAKDLKAFSIVMLCILSSLYRSQDKDKFAIGHKLLKPSQGYTEADAHNALSDLRHFEITALATGIFIDPPALITKDIALAALWTTLRPRGFTQGSTLGMQLEIEPALFNDLDQRAAESVALVLQEHSRP